MSIVPHKFAGIEVDQAAYSFNIGKHSVPKGYVNLTQMCKAGKKKISNFWENKRTKAYMACVSTDAGIPTNELIVEIIGGGSEITSELQGTWGHHLVALSLASWISPDFELLANKVLWGVITGDYEALTTETEEQQQQLQQQWDVIREAGKVTRLKLTDAIQTWYERNPNGTTRPAHAMYAQTTDNIYKALWSKTAKQLEEYLGCDRHEVRNVIDSDSLAILERTEDRVIEFIEEDNIKPVDAVNAANIRAKKYIPKSKLW